jgi:hypothetical protein
VGEHEGYGIIGLPVVSVFRFVCAGRGQGFVGAEFCCVDGVVYWDGGCEGDQFLFDC